MKKCNSCKTEKELSEFYKNKSSKDGLQYKCKTCAKQYHKQYHADNTDYFKQYNKQWCADNPEALAERDKRRRTKYPEKLKAQNKAKNIPSIKGMHRHHWSYLEEHWLDVIYVDANLHRYYHTLMQYDKTLWVYRVKSTGELLDTRAKHEAFLQSLPMVCC